MRAERRDKARGEVAPVAEVGRQRGPDLAGAELEQPVARATSERGFERRIAPHVSRPLLVRGACEQQVSARCQGDQSVTLALSMPNLFARAEAAVLGPVHRPPLSGVAEHGAFWSAAALLDLILLRFLPGTPGILGALAMFIAVPVWLVFTCIILYRWLVNHVLWKVRNRLIVTYLLMGLAPVVLFATLATIAAYVFSGQFATFAATSELGSTLGRLSAEKQGFAVHVAHAIARSPSANTVELADYEGANHSILGRLLVDAWVSTTADDNRRAADQRRQGIAAAQRRGPHRLSFLGARWLSRRGPRSRPSISSCSEYQDRCGPSGDLCQQCSARFRDRQRARTGPRPDPHHSGCQQGLPGRRGQKHTPRAPPYSRELAAETSSTISGGTLPPRSFLLDRQITFSAPLNTLEWENGKKLTSLLSVTSRPALLYKQLFSAADVVGTVIRYMLISMAIFFAILELIALHHGRPPQPHHHPRGRRTLPRHPRHRQRQLRASHPGAAPRSARRALQLLQQHVRVDRRLLEQQREKERMQSEL